MNNRNRNTAEAVICGLESAEDLIDDIKQALDCIGK